MAMIVGGGNVVAVCGSGRREVGAGARTQIPNMTEAVRREAARRGLVVGS